MHIQNWLRKRNHADVRFVLVQEEKKAGSSAGVGKAVTSVHRRYAHRWVLRSNRYTRQVMECMLNCLEEADDRLPRLQHNLDSDDQQDEEQQDEEEEVLSDADFISGDSSSEEDEEGGTEDEEEDEDELERLEEIRRIKNQRRQFHSSLPNNNMSASGRRRGGAPPAPRYQSGVGFVARKGDVKGKKHRAVPTNSSSTTSSPMLSFKLKGVRVDLFDTFLHFLYRGHCHDLTAEKALPLMRMCNEDLGLQDAGQLVDLLFEKCREAFVSGLTASNVLGLAKEAEKSKEPKLVQAAMAFILHNLSDSTLQNCVVNSSPKWRTRIATAIKTRLQ